MQRPMAILLLLVILLTLDGTSFLVGQNATIAHVAVIRFSNETGSASYDAACKAATDTLVLTLQQLGRYRVQAEERAGSGDEGLRAMAEEGRFDFIMYGKMSKSQSGGIDCALSVYDRAKGKTTLSRTGKAVGVLDVFDAADELVVSVLESMTGSHIGFGSLTLKNTGENGSYRVLLDGNPVGNDLASLERVLNGRHEVTIAQKRMLGDREIARSSVEVKEGETAELAFAVPFLMDDERQRLEALTSAIADGWNDLAQAGDVDARLRDLSSLSGDLSYSPKLSSYKDEATQLAGEWELRKARLDIENSAWEPRLELLDATSSQYAGAAAYPDPDKIRKAFEGNARLEAVLFELEAGKAIGDGDIPRALDCFEDALMVSARYLGRKRIMDYAYALTKLEEFQEKAGTRNTDVREDRDVKTVFGDWVQAGQRFYGLREQVEAGTASVIVASDFATELSVDGARFAPAPLGLKPISGPRSMSIRQKGTATILTLKAAGGEKLLFAEDGPAAFGKASARTAAARTTDPLKLFRSGKPAEVQVALSKGVSVNAPQRNGETPLMAAAGNPNLEVILILLRAGADINAKDNNGKTALMEAARISQNSDVILKLLAAHADAWAKDRFGQNAFDYLRGNAWLRYSQAYGKLATYAH